MIRNVHYRDLPVPPERIWTLIEGIASADSVWPGEHWPPVRLDRGLEVGSAGGHGPIRYHVIDYQPGERVEFAFEPRVGLNGTHAFEVNRGSLAGSTLIRHVLVGRPRGSGRLRWLFVLRWLHDAVLEEVMDNIATAVGHPPRKPARWSPWVRLLRKVSVRPNTPTRTR